MARHSLSLLLPAFFRAYASGDAARLGAFTAGRTPFPGLGGAVRFAGISRLLVPAAAGTIRHLTVTVVWQVGARAHRPGQPGRVARAAQHELRDDSRPARRQLAGPVDHRIGHPALADAMSPPTTGVQPPFPIPGVMMSTHLLAAAPPVALSSSGLVTYLQTLFGPLFLGIVGIVAIFFLFTREILRFVQFFVLAVAIAVIFYVPGIVRSLAMGIAHALGVH